jgi:pimeloyl-ACP methyl ester carboxylesterase
MGCHPFLQRVRRVVSVFFIALVAVGCGGPSPLSLEAAAQPLSDTPLPAGLEDHSPHQARFVEVEPGVKLEVLDWGGEGPAMVLLTGLGDNAHVYDDFANQFVDRFHVFGITRRGFGRSSQPEGGYDVATRAIDDLRVLDALDIDKAIFVGHSMAGDELSALGADHAGRVEKLVYLDAYDYGVQSTLEQPPSADYDDDDLVSVARFTAANARFTGSRPPLSSLPGVYRFDATGAVVAPVSPPEISAKMAQGSKQADFERIQAPVLAIFAPLSKDVPQLFYNYLTAEQKAGYDRTFPPIVDWQTNAIQRFRQGVRNAHVVELPGALHYIYLNNEGLVVLEMRKFLLQNP